MDMPNNVVCIAQYERQDELLGVIVSFNGESRRVVHKIVRLVGVLYVKTARW